VDAFAAFTAFKPEVSIPSYNAFASYDALYMLKAACEAAGTLPLDEASTDAVIQELEAFGALGPDGKPTNLFVGVSGNLSAGEEGHDRKPGSVALLLRFCYHPRRRTGRARLSGKGSRP